MSSGWYVSESLMDDAKKEAEKMLKTGKKIRPIKFGDSMNSIFVSTEKDLVRGTDSFELGGKEFHVGWKKQ